MDYAVGEFVYMLPSDMNLWIGNVRNYNNKTLISSPSFKIGTNVKINLNGEQAKLKDEPEVKCKEVDNWRLMVKTEPDVKPKVITKPNIEPNKEHKRDVHWALPFKHSSKGSQYKPDLLSLQFNYIEKRSKLSDKITYEEEKVALILGITSIFTVWWIFK